MLALRPFCSRTTQGREFGPFTIATLCYYFRAAQAQRMAQHAAQRAPKTSASLIAASVPGNTQLPAVAACLTRLMYLQAQLGADAWPAATAARQDRVRQARQREVRDCRLQGEPGSRCISSWCGAAPRLHRLRRFHEVLGLHPGALRHLLQDVKSLGEHVVAGAQQLHWSQDIHVKLQPAARAMTSGGGGSAKGRVVAVCACGGQSMFGVAGMQMTDTY